MLFVSYKCTNGNILIFTRGLWLTAGNGPQRVFRTHFERGNVFKGGVVPPGQLLRRPSTPKPFIEPGFSIFLMWSFFVFAFRRLRVFHWGCYVYFRIVFSSNSWYILYIFIFIYFIYFFIVLIVDLLIIPLRFVFFFVFAVVSLWHPGVGRDVRKKPLPYNYFFTSMF